jgi:hypothetical protein
MTNATNRMIVSVSLMFVSVLLVAMGHKDMAVPTLLMVGTLWVGGGPPSGSGPKAS